MFFHKYILFILLFFLKINAIFGQEKGYAINYKESDASRLTSSSELYDPNKLTAAHNTIPIGTYVQITRIDNGASVIVRINDRGPFIPNRILALSKAAANKLGLKKYEKIYVQLSIVPKKESQSTPIESIEKKPEIPFYQPGSTQISSGMELKEPVKLKLQPKEEVDTQVTQQMEKTDIPRVLNESLKDGIYQLQMNKISEKGFAIQIGSFQNTAILWKEIAKLHNRWFKQILVQTYESANGIVTHKLMLGPFSTKEKASSYKNNLKEKYGIEGFIISLEE
jgi:rare lipoprotein A